MEKKAQKKTEAVRTHVITKKDLDNLRAILQNVERPLGQMDALIKLGFEEAFSEHEERAAAKESQYREDKDVYWPAVFELFGDLRNQVQDQLDGLEALLNDIEREQLETKEQ